LLIICFDGGLRDLSFIYPVFPVKCFERFASHGIILGNGVMARKLLVIGKVNKKQLTPRVS